MLKQAWWTHLAIFNIETVFATHRSDEVQSLIKLCQVALVLPTNTAGCERGFSAQNRIKNALRNRLKGERLDVLITIDIQGPPSKDLTFLQLLMFGLEPTEDLVHVCLLVIKKGIEVYKGMPGGDSAVKCFEVWSMVIDLSLNVTRKKKSWHQ